MCITLVVIRVSWHVGNSGGCVKNIILLLLFLWIFLMMIFLCTLYFLRANFYYQNHQIALLWHMVSVNSYIITFLGRTGVLYLRSKTTRCINFRGFFVLLLCSAALYKKIDTYYYSIFWEKKIITSAPFIINCWLFLQRCWTVLWFTVLKQKSE